MSSKCLITPIFLINDFLSLWFFWKDWENYFHIYLLTARRSTQSSLKEINPEYSLEGLMLKFQWPPEEPTHWKRPWCWERLKVGGEGDDRGLDGWMASLTQWTWLWASSRRWWRTGKPGVLQSMGLQRVGHNWATEKQQILALFCTFSSWEISLYFKQWVLDLSKRFILLIGVTTFSFLGSTLDFFGFYELSNFLAGCTSSFPQD